MGEKRSGDARVARDMLSEHPDAGYAEQKRLFTERGGVCLFAMNNLCSRIGLAAGKKSGDALLARGILIENPDAGCAEQNRLFTERGAVCRNAINANTHPVAVFALANGAADFAVQNSLFTERGGVCRNATLNQRKHASRCGICPRKWSG